MATEREYEGPSEDEALQAAAAALGIAVTQLDYTLIDEGAEGVFGLGARPVRIRVRLPDASASAAGGASPEGDAVASSARDTSGSTAEEGSASPSEDAPAAHGPSASGGEDAEAANGDEEGPTRRGLAPEKAERAGTVTGELLEHLGVKGRVTVEDDEENIVVRVEDDEGSTDVSDLFARARPPLAPSFQFLLNKIVNRFPEDRKHVVLQAAGAKARAVLPSQAPVRKEGEEVFDPELVTLAEQLGEKAKDTGKVLTVHPMQAGDRRAVHQTLMKVEGVKTVSSGEGLYRQMHIVASGLGEAGDRGRRKRRRSGRRTGGG